MTVDSVIERALEEYKTKKHNVNRNEEINQLLDNVFMYTDNVLDLFKEIQQYYPSLYDDVSDAVYEYLFTEVDKALDGTEK